ncbi:hypothetical protein IV498_05045 [Paenarthrobacter sp. Z7-10]|nr:hypothetical protein [Paenarthrobacter sp. Z7-10]
MKIPGLRLGVFDKQHPGLSGEGVPRPETPGDAFCFSSTEFLVDHDDDADDGNWLPHDAVNGRAARLASPVL